MTQGLPVRGSPEKVRLSFCWQSRLVGYKARIARVKHMDSLGKGEASTVWSRAERERKKDDII